MQGYINCASELTSINPEDINLTLGRSDQDVVLARMDIKARNFARVNEELSEWGDSQSIVTNLYKLLLNAVGSSEREHTKLGLLRVNWLEVIDQMATVRIVSHLVPLEHF